MSHKGFYGDKRKRIIKLLKQGKSYSKITQEVGVSGTRIGEIKRMAKERGELES